MVEKRLSVRLAAVGGDQLRAELMAVGRSGKDALEAIGTSSRPASAGLENVGNSSAATVRHLEALANRAAQVAAGMRAAGASTGTFLERVERSTGVTPGFARSAEDIAAYGRALDDTRAKFNPTFAAIRQYRQALAEVRQAHAVGAISADEMAAAISRERQQALGSIAAIRGRTAALDQMSRASRGSTLRLQQMSFQLNDIGVSLAGGMNPFVVMAQQGTQIAQIYGFGQGGVSGALRDVRGLIVGILTRVPALTAAVAATAVAVGGLTYEINQASDVSVSLGDTMLATLQVIGNGIWGTLKPAVDAIAPFFSTAWDLVVQGVKTAGNAIINGMQAAFATVRIVWQQLPGMMGEAAIGGANLVLAGMNRMISGAIERLNSLAARVNAVLERVPGLPDDWRVGGVEPQSIPLLPNPYAGATAGTGDLIAGRVREIMGQDPLGDFFDAVKIRAVNNALARTAEETTKAGRAARETRDRIGDLIKGLERERDLLLETDPVQQRLIELRDQTAEATEAQMQRIRDLVVMIAGEKTGWRAVSRDLAEYAREAKDLAGGIGDALTGAFSSAEDAIVQFVTTGKLSVSDMATSIIADLSRIAARKFILGPIMGGLSGALGSSFLGSASSLASLLPSADGGGYTGNGARAGGLDGRGGFLAMLHPQETVVDHTRQRGGRDAPPMVMNVYARDARSFRQSRTQIASDVGRMISMSRRVT